MAVKTKAEILAEIATLLADNTVGDISALDVRTVVNDITDSYENLITAGSITQYYRGDKTFQNLTASAVTNVQAGNIIATNVQAAINELDSEKQVTITGAASTVTTSNLTANKAVISNASGKIADSATTSTEIGYLSGVTSAIQTQLNAKEPSITSGTTSQYWRGDKVWADVSTYSIKYTLNSATINALDSSPIVMIAAPGANKILIVDNATVYFQSTNTPFLGSYNLMLYYATANEDIMVAVTKAELQSATDTITTAYNTTNYAGAGTPFTDAIINKAVNLKATNTIYDGVGTLVISLTYRIISI